MPRIKKAEKLKQQKEENKAELERLQKVLVKQPVLFYEDGWRYGVCTEVVRKGSEFKARVESPRFQSVIAHWVSAYDVRRYEA